MPLCHRPAILEVDGQFFCRQHAELYKPRTKTPIETLESLIRLSQPAVFNADDAALLESDRKVWTAIMKIEVSPDVAEECREELRKAAQRGYRIDRQAARGWKGLK